MIRVMDTVTEANQISRNAQALHKAKKTLGEKYVFAPEMRVTRMTVKPAVLSRVRVAEGGQA